MTMYSICTTSQIGKRSPRTVTFHHTMSGLKCQVALHENFGTMSYKKSLYGKNNKILTFHLNSPSIVPKL